MSFTLATYNILADVYIQPAWYPHSSPALLAPAQRHPALVQSIIDLAADIICLQEVEAAVFEDLNSNLSTLGYSGYFTKKGQAKPDGCAIFFRSLAFDLIKFTPIDYRDAGEGNPNSGHIAQIVILSQGPRSLGIANTHLKWDNPQTHYGYRQMQQLLVECEALNVQSWIICGDLNVMPSSKVVALLQQAGFNFTHQNAIKAHTCNSNNRAKTLDYLFYNAGLSAEPLPLFPIEDDTPLPGPNQPSDHLPVVAQFRWLT